MWLLIYMTWQRLTSSISSQPAGHPRASKVAVFDIITPDLVTGPNAAAAEGIAIINDCLDMFGDLSQHYVVLVSHSKSTFEGFRLIRPAKVDSCPSPRCCS